MNDKNRRNLESGQRCRQWIVDNAALIPLGSVFATKCATLTANVGAIEDLAGQIEASVGESLSATDVKGSERLDMLDLMEKVRSAARAAEFDHPGTRDRYRYTTTMSHQGLLAAGRSFAAGGNEDEALLISYGAPADWPADMTDACDEFETSFAQQDSAIGSRIARNAEIAAALADLTTLKATVGHLIKNYAATSPGAQASWTSAAHVESGPTSPPPPTPPTP